MLQAALAHLTNTAYASVTFKAPLLALKIGGIHGEDRKVNFLVFNHDASKPICILKLTRKPSAEARLEHEYQSLSAIAAIPEFTSLVPQPIDLFEVDGRPIMAEGCVDGIPLNLLLKRNQRSGPAQVQADLHRIQELLTLFQNKTCSGRSPFQGQDAVLELLNRYGTSLQLPDDFVLKLMQLAEVYRGLKIPLTGSHGDFWAGNILIDGSRINIIDWEDYAPNQSPTWDIFLFAVTYAFTYPWRKWRKLDKESAFKRAFLAEGWLPAQLRAFVHQSLKAVHLPTEAAHLLFCLFLLELAVPGAAHSQGRTAQHERWQNILQLYARNAEVSIFG